MEQSRLLLLGKLRAKAEDHACTSAERETYMEKVTELMAKWAVTDAMLSQGTESTKDVIIRVWLECQGPLVLSRAMTDLAHRVAVPLGVQAFWYKPDPSRQFLFAEQLVGFTSDVDRVRWLWESLQSQVMEEIADATPCLPTWPGMNRNEKDVWRSSFIRAYALRVRARLTEAMTQAVDTSAVAHVPGVALAMQDRRAQVTAFVAGSMETKADNRRRRVDHSATDLGYAAGARASLGEDTLGQASRAWLGR